MLKVHDRVRIKPSETFGIVQSVDEGAGVYTVEVHGSTEPARLKDSDVTRIDEVEFSEISKVLSELDRIEVFAKVMADHSCDTRIFCSIDRDEKGINGASIWFKAGDGAKTQVADLGASKASDLVHEIRGLDLAEMLPSYGDDRDEVGYRWRIALYSGLYSISTNGKDAFPPQLPGLYRIFESFGVPTVWDDTAEGPYYTHAVD